MRVEANHTPHKFAWFSGDPGNYQALLGGKAIQHALYFGNHVEIHADGMLLVISTPMRYHAAGEQPPDKHQLLLDIRRSHVDILHGADVGRSVLLPGRGGGWHAGLPHCQRKTVRA